MSGSASTANDGGYFAVAPRALGPDDGVAARALIHATLGFTPYLDRVVELFDEASRGESSEARALVIERDATMAGMVLYGLVAGAPGAARLHAILVRQTVNRDAVIARLVDAAAAAARAAGARLLVAELAEDAALAPLPLALLHHGFRVVGRIADFYRDGVDQVVLQRDLSSRGA